MINVYKTYRNKTIYRIMKNIKTSEYHVLAGSNVRFTTAFHDKAMQYLRFISN